MECGGWGTEKEDGINMPFVIDKTTGSRQFVDKNQVQAGSTSPMGEMDQDQILQMYTSGAFGAPGSTGAGRYLTQLKELGVLGEEEDQGIKNKNSHDSRLGVLESLWFPNEDKLALPEQGNWVKRQTHKLGKLYEGSSEYELFRRYARTLGATLAKAAGDTGNIAWAEQAAQLQALADADLTKEEAQVAFENIREGLDLPKRDAKYYNQLRKSSPTTINKDESKQEFAKVNLPGSPAMYRTGGLLAGSLLGPAGTAIGGGVGGALADIEETGIPLTREAGKREYGGKQAIKKAAAPLGAAALQFLLGGGLGKLREASVARTQIPGSSVIESGKKLLESSGLRPEYQPMVEKLLGRDTAKYATKNLKGKEILDLLGGRGKAFGKAGDIKAGAANTYNAATRLAVRQQLPFIADLLTKTMGTGIKVSQGVKNLLKLIGTGATIGAAGYLGGKASRGITGE